MCRRGPAIHFAGRKHVNIKLNYIMNLGRDGGINLYKVDTGDMIADYLTKPVLTKDFGAQLYKPKYFQIGLVYYA